MSNWNLASHDRAVAIAINAGDNGAISGAVTCAGTHFTVTGGWDASGSLPGRNFSAFSFAGGNDQASPVWIGATGIMTGPGHAPTQVDIQIDLSSSRKGTLTHLRATLFPA